jgi:hypothetical protein
MLGAYVLGVAGGVSILNNGFLPLDIVHLSVGLAGEIPVYRSFLSYSYTILSYIF